LVQGLERHLTVKSSPGAQSWDMLSAAGLLREKGLIDFALARVCEDNVRQAMQASGTAAALAQLPVKLLGHDNIRIAEMARMLLFSEQRTAGSDAHLFHRLPGEDLHLLCWRIVAALQENQLLDAHRLAESAKALLDAHSDGIDPAMIARKLVFFLTPDHRAQLVDPGKAGMHLFVAALAQDYGLNSDLLFRLIGGDSPAPLLLLLKGQGVAIEMLPYILIALRGAENADASPVLANAYALLDPVEARATIATWAADADVLP
jgi:hypothetical protein